MHCTKPLCLMQINAGCQRTAHLCQMWQSIFTAPFDRDLEVAVFDHDGPHALVFPCRRALEGWIKVETEERIDVRPTHWRPWNKVS